MQNIFHSNVPRDKSGGFTLIEMAVVVFLIGILATMGLSAASSILANSAISNTKKKQEVIRDVLITYMATNKRLPCPAIDENGIEAKSAAVPSICTGYFGILPYQTLGLSKSAALDGWENLFSYAVSSQWTLAYANTNTATTSNNANISFNAGDAGTLPVSNRTPATNATNTSLGSDAIIVISHGMNGLGALTSKGTRNSLPSNVSDEFANVAPDTFVVPASFYQREYTDIDVPTYGSFDDVLLRLSAAEIISQLTKDGAIKSANAEWAEQLVNIKNAIIGYMLSTANLGCPVPEATQIDNILSDNNIPLIDPWGDSISANYTPGYCKLKNGYVTKYPSCVATSTGPIASYTITTPNGGTILGETNDKILGSAPAIFGAKCI